jgi:hypothetical protein
MSNEVENRAAVEGVQADAGERVGELVMPGIPDVLEHLLQSQRDHHHPRQNRKVKEAVGIPRQSGARFLGLIAESVLSLEGSDVEVCPPQGCGQGQSRDRAGHDRP